MDDFNRIYGRLDGACFCIIITVIKTIVIFNSVYLMVLPRQFAQLAIAVDYLYRVEFFGTLLIRFIRVAF